MKQDMIFFSADGKGLTSTSANHIANLAKEMIRREESTLDSIVLYSTSVALIGAANAEQLSIGTTPEEVESVVGKLHDIAKAKSLIAWLREAIKAKERLYNEANATTLEDYAKEQGITLPEYPVRGDSIDEDDYFASLSIDERNRYYQTETLAAVLGKAIHPGGSIADAREALDKRNRTPREIKGEGRDTLIYTYKPSVEQNLVDEIYFSLQKMYREAQAKVNSFKYDCTKAVNESATAANAKYVKEVAEYENRMKLLNAELADYKKRRTAKIQDYKILIPQSLQEIFERVSQLGKK